MPADAATERSIMVDSQVRPNDVPDLAIQDAMRALPREDLLPPEKRFLAYADAQVEYAPGCSTPFGRASESGRSPSPRLTRRRFCRGSVLRSTASTART
jgi:hypothetical protein